MSLATRPNTFSMREARAILADLFQRNRLAYWLDLLASMAIGYGAAAVYLEPSLSWNVRLPALIVAAFALFRVGSFIHEITHMRHGEMRGFRIFWNLACGIPLLMPSFFYTNHNDHHKSHHYGTAHDGEYVPLGSRAWQHIVLFFAQAFVVPLYVFTRFLLSPLTFVNARVRNWTLERCSSFVFNFHHHLTIPASAPRRLWAATELACCLRCWLMLAVVATGAFPWTRLPQLYVISVCVLGLNYLRNLAAHHYRNDGREMTHAEQLADSVNIRGGPLTELFFPLSLRYHALHHLFPALPFHNLATAHRRLMAQLPADSVYRETVYPSFWAVFRELLADARAAAERGRPHAPGRDPREAAGEYATMGRVP